MPSTSSWEAEVVIPPDPLVQVPSPPSEPSLVTDSELVELRMLPQFQLIPLEEVVVEEVEDSEQSLFSN